MTTVPSSRRSSVTVGRLRRWMTYTSVSPAATIRPWSTPSASTPASASPLKMAALRRMWAKRRSPATSKKPTMATMTIAASVACGRSANSGARNAPVSRISPAANTEASWLRPPAPSAAAVWLAPPDCTKPEESPASAFAAPIATRSRLGSTR